MPVEVIGADDGVDKLNETWPDGSEPVKQGDDHLRNIKKAVKNDQKRNWGISNRNLFRNGDFSVDQRFKGATSPLQGGTVKYADGWSIRGTAGVGGTATVGKSETRDWEYLYINHTSPTSYGYIVQKLEVSHVSEFEGEELTFSCLTHFDKQVVSALTCFWTEIGVLTPASAAVTVPITTSTNALDEISATVTVPPLTSWVKDKEYALALRFDYVAEGDVTPTGVFRFGEMKLERGSKVTPFIRVPQAETLAECQRYYWKMGGVVGSGADIYGFAVNPSSTTRHMHVPYPTTMRAVPTVNAQVDKNQSDTQTLVSVDHTRVQVANVGTGSVFLIDFEADAEV